MSGHEWVQDKNKDHLFGKITHNGLINATDNWLRNTRGIRISTTYGVRIAYWSQHGGVTKPRITCTADKFEITE
jgi:hypothetical protein